MNLAQEFFNKIRNEVNIAIVVQGFAQLKRRGKDYVGLCPFHSEDTPSFTVNVEKKFYHCFGCGSHGDVIQFVASSQSIPYKEAALQIAKEHGIEAPSYSKSQSPEFEISEQIFKSLEIANLFFQSNLDSLSKDYLDQRGVKEDFLKTFEIGYSPGQGKLVRHLEQNAIPISIMEQAGLVSKTLEGRVYEMFRNRIMFPIKNSYGQTLGFGGRTIDNANPKYLNSPETIVFKKSSVLFGEHLAINAGYKTNSIILVEGYLDVIAMSSAELKNTVAALGTAVTSNHLAKLWQYVDEIILCLDQDRGGINATQRVINIAAEYVSTKKRLSVMLLPNGMDPDGAINVQKLDIRKILEERMPLSEAIWHYSTSGSKLISAEQKAQLENSLSEYSNKIKDSILRKNFHQFFKEKLKTNTIRYNRNTPNSTILSQEKTSIPTFSHETDAENIEYCIVMFIVSNPKLISDTKAVEELSRLSFSNDKTETFFTWLVDECSQHLDNTQSILEKIQNSNFKSLYNTKIKNYSDYPENKTDAFGSLTMLCNRHKLERLKLEYLNLLKEPGLRTEAQNTSIEMYKKEISKLVYEINQKMSNAE